MKQACGLGQFKVGRGHCPGSCPSEAGFLAEVAPESSVLGPGYDRPYQLDPAVREPRSIQLYQHLNLKSCIWTFDAYYDMTELIDVCGGSVTADFQVRAPSPALPPIPDLSSQAQLCLALECSCCSALYGWSVAFLLRHLEENSAVCIYFIYFPRSITGFILLIFRAPGKYLFF